MVWEVAYSSVLGLWPGVVKSLGSVTWVVVAAPLDPVRGLKVPSHY